MVLRSPGLCSPPPRQQCSCSQPNPTSKAALGSRANPLQHKSKRAGFGGEDLHILCVCACFFFNDVQRKLQRLQLKVFSCFLSPTHAPSLLPMNLLLSITDFGALLVACILLLLRGTCSMAVANCVPAPAPHGTSQASMGSIWDKERGEMYSLLAHRRGLCSPLSGEEHLAPPKLGWPEVSRTFCCPPCSLFFLFFPNQIFLLSEKIHEDGAVALKQCSRAIPSTHSLAGSQTHGGFILVQKSSWP